MRPIQVPRVAPFDHHDAGILPEAPGELAVANIHRVDARRAALKKAVRKASCRGPDVQRDTAGRIDSERVQGRLQFEAAPPHIGMLGPGHFN